MSTKNMTALTTCELQAVTGGLSLVKFPFPFDPCPFPGPIIDPVDPTLPVFYL